MNKVKINGKKTCNFFDKKNYSKWEMALLTHNVDTKYLKVTTTLDPWPHSLPGSTNVVLPGRPCDRGSGIKYNFLLLLFSVLKYKVNFQGLPRGYENLHW